MFAIEGDRLVSNLNDDINAHQALDFSIAYTFSMVVVESVHLLHSWTYPIFPTFKMMAPLLDVVHVY